MAHKTGPNHKAPEQATFTAEQPRRFIKLAKVKDYTSLSTSEIYRRIAAGRFPAQVTLGPKSVAWVEAEIISWLDSLAALRDETTRRAMCS